MINQDLIRLFAESLKYKDQGLLKSALKKREEAGRLTQGNAEDYSLAKVNEAVLLGHHVGDGIRAYEAAKESLKDIKALERADREWQNTVMRFSPLRDVLGFIVNWAESYEEAISYSKLTEDRYPNDSIAKMQTQSLIKAQTSGDPWWKTQITIAHQFYSRSVQSEDAGKHASGMAVLHCILARAGKEMPGYDIDASDAFDILDDYVCLSLRAYNEIFEKFRIALSVDTSLGTVDGAAEQYIIFINPLSIWLEFMSEWSDCPATLKTEFQKHYEVFKQSPFPVLPDILNKLASYFPNAKVEIKNCGFCGHGNSTISPVCIKCGHQFNDTMMKTNTNYRIDNSMKGNISGNSNQQPMSNKSDRPPGCSIAVLLIGLPASIALWWWAVGQGEVKWYGIVIAVIVSLFTLAMGSFKKRNSKK